MDSKVKKKTYAERLKINKSFYLWLLTYILFAIIVCAAGLGYLWFWLERYEARSVNGAMTRYMQMVGNREWDEIYDEDVGYFLELNDRKTYQKYLIWLYGDANVSGMTFSYSTSDAYSDYYDVYYQQEKLCALEVHQDKESDSWKVRTVSQNNYYTFDVIEDGTDFRINDVLIDDTFEHEDVHIPMGFEGFGFEDRLPNTKRYRIGGFIQAPELSLTNKNYTYVLDHTKNNFYLGRKPTDEEIEYFTKEITDTAIAYCKYITRDGTFYSLNQHLYPNTPFYYNILGFDPQWFSPHDRIEFNNIEVFDLMPIGDDFFVGSISFDYHVIASDVSKTYSSTYQLFFAKNVYNQWRMCDMAIIFDNSADEE
ncbi:MAG: hypothetical protein IKE36_05615 [Solobacterium sp.]|nr:hypothetical protein [Solobacterium sp.]